VICSASAAKLRCAISVKWEVAIGAAKTLDAAKALAEAHAKL
jgi:hypothetical protein